MGRSLGLFPLGVAVVFGLVCLGFDSAVAGIGGALVGHSVEHFGEFEYASILFEVHPFPESMGIEQVLLLFFLHPPDFFLHLSFVAVLEHLFLLLLLPELAVIFVHEVVDGLLIVAMRMFDEGFALDPLALFLLLDLLLVVLEDVAEVALLHEVDFALLVGGVPERHAISFI